MTIQSYIDRKRAAGAREHEGNKTDWAGWTLRDFHVAMAGELLDLINYAQRAVDLFYEGGETEAILGDAEVCLSLLSEEALEAACQEAEQEAENG